MSQEVCDNCERCEMLEGEVAYLENRVQELEGELETNNKPRIKEAWRAM